MAIRLRCILRRDTILSAPSDVEEQEGYTRTKKGPGIVCVLEAKAVLVSSLSSGLRRSEPSKNTPEETTPPA